MGIFLILTVLLLPAAATDPLWHSDFEGYTPDVAISDDGNLIVVTTAMAIHSFDRSGAALWQFTDGSGISDTAISRNGLLIVTGSGNNVILLDHNGTLLWNVTIPAKNLHCTQDWITSVAISDDSNFVAAGTSDGNVFVVTRNGTVEWEQNKNPGAGQVLVNPAGDFVVSQLDSRRIYAFDHVGNVSWWQVLPAYITGLAMTRDDAVIAGTNGGDVDLYIGTGNRVWTSTLGGRINDLAATPDGSTIVAGAGDWTVNNLDRDGILRWTRELDADVTSISTSSDGRTIAAGSANSTAYCYAGNGTLLWGFVPRTDISTDYEGTKVAVSGDGQVIAVLARQAYDSYGKGGKSTLYLFSRDSGQLTHELSVSPESPSPSVPFLFSVVSTGPAAWIVLTVIGLALVGYGLFRLRSPLKLPSCDVADGPERKENSPWHYVSLLTLGLGVCLILCGMGLALIPAPVMHEADHTPPAVAMNAGPNLSVQPTVMMARMDAQRTSVFDTVSGGIIPAGKIVWKYHGTYVYAKLFPVSDGRIFLTQTDKVTALNATTGALLWNSDTGSGTGMGGPAIAGDRVYLSTYHGTMALNASNGARVWVLPAGYPQWRESPVIGNGTVFVYDSEALYAADAATGRLIWRFTGKGENLQPPVLYNGTVFVPTGKGDLVVLDEQNGHRIRTIHVGDSRSTAPVIANKMIYITPESRTLVAYDIDSGMQVWNFTALGTIGDSPAVTRSMVYFSSDDNHLYALDAITGEPWWNFTAQHKIGVTPAVADGIVYAGSLDKNLYAFNATSGNLLLKISTGNCIWSTPSVVDGMVYIGSSDGYLYAVG